MRKSREIFLTATDFTNAFGSVLHQFIFDTLRAKGLSDDFIKMLLEMFTDISTTISVRGKMIDSIFWNCEVIHGDPLSLFIFNICFDGVSFYPSFKKN